MKRPQPITADAPEFLAVDVLLRAPCKRREHAAKSCPEARVVGNLDTGAAGTMIDEAVARRLGLAKVGTRKSRGVHDAAARTIDMYGVELSFPGRGLRDVSLLKRGAGLLTSGDRERPFDVLVGRDSMADAGMNLEYDAPSGRTKLKSSRKRRKRARR